MPGTYSEWHVQVASAAVQFVMSPATQQGSGAAVQVGSGSQCVRWFKRVIRLVSEYRDYEDTLTAYFCCDLPA